VRSAEKISAKERFERFVSLQSNSVFYRLTLAFSLLFLGSLLGFGFLGLSSGFLDSEELLYCLLGILIVSLGAYAILKQIAHSIMNIEAKLTGKSNSESILSCRTGESELSNIARLTEEMIRKLEQMHTALSSRTLEMQGIMDLSSFDFLDSGPQALISMAMEKAIGATGAMGGAVLLFPGKHDKAEAVSCIYLRGKVFLQDFPGLKELSRRIVERTLAKPHGLLFGKEDPLFDKVFSPRCNSVAAVSFNLGSGQNAVAIVTAGCNQDWDSEVLNFLSVMFHTMSCNVRMNEIRARKQEMSRELNAVLTMLRVITSDLHETELFSVIASSLFDLYPAQWLGLALLDPLTGELRLENNIHRNTEGIGRVVKLNRASSLFQRAIDMMGRLDCDELESKQGYFEKQMFAKLELRSCMIHCLHLNGRILGAICLGAENASAFGTRDKKYFTMSASVAAIALEQNRLLAKEKRKSNELEILNRVGVALTSSAFDIKRVLHHILEMVVKLIGTEAGLIMLLDRDVLTVQAAKGVTGENVAGLQVNLGQGICGWVATTGEVLVNHDIQASPHLLSEIDARAGVTTRSTLCIPMISNGRVIGVLQLINKVGKFSDDDLRTVKAVSSSTAIALENNRLYTETSRLVEKERFIRTIFQKYVPKEIVNNILEKDEHEQMVIGERKVITVFNIDIRGYSEMSKNSATEEVVEILNYFYMKMGSIILRNKGMVDKYLGDGFLAIFGAPLTTSNPALDAVFAAIEMIKTIHEVSRLSIERCGIPLKIGISLNTGEAIVGNIGFDRKMEYTAIGDVVNETFRIQELTRQKSDLILIGESTYQLVKPFVLAHPWGMREIDDNGSAMMVYEVVARKDIDHALVSMAVEQELTIQRIQ
jgi:class 3 adenylate cyclase/putative methionine-R-sulfoxide reductase with GAF domain